jgi:glycosyltransferase involved in cell wall biosynthesis
MRPTKAHSDSAQPIGMWSSRGEVTLPSRLATFTAAEPHQRLGSAGALKRVAFLGNSLPRRCGIATFTTDLRDAVGNSRPSLDTSIIAMTDTGRQYEYGSSVCLQIRESTIADYLNAARFLNEGAFDLLCLQHEFGIFGGPAGDYVLALLSRLNMPIVTTFHTILPHPDPDQRRVTEEICRLSEKVVVMAEKGWEFLQTQYGVAASKIAVIPHGVPDFPFVDPDKAKAELGFSGRPIILTFGLLGPSKGIDRMIETMPLILEQCPDALYVVLGATHPKLLQSEGETYRETLSRRVRELAIETNVVFLDQFVDQAELLRFISMCDVYVTPYVNEAQMTSGTLAYSFGLGKAVVSTPYWHARELLADGGGVLVPFDDIPAMGKAVSGLLADGDMRLALRRRAYASSRGMTWEATAKLYLALFETVKHKEQLTLTEPARTRPIDQTAMPRVRLDHLLGMCDDTGLLQHAVHSVPDRAHGYCIDDNARALLLVCNLERSTEEPIPAAVAGRFTSFIQHAWNAEAGRFRNFLSYGRDWLEEVGSEDSHGRALWALGACAANGKDASRQSWARSLFLKAVSPVQNFASPRAWAFSLLGIDHYAGANAMPPGVDRLRRDLAGRLMSLLSSTGDEGWHWFEDVLAYDNARLPQALLVTGRATSDPDCTGAGLRSLRWLTNVQTSPQGYFRPVGSDSFGHKRALPQLFDQQPLEACATISACLAAWRVDGNSSWRAMAETAFEWFLGRNDLGCPLVDVATGSCRDGLHPDRANENRGAESVLSYLLSVVELRNTLLRDGLVEPRKISALSAYSVTLGKSADLVSSHILEPPSPPPSA